MLLPIKIKVNIIFLDEDRRENALSRPFRAGSFEVEFSPGLRFAHPGL
jgi:hypothetical protein